MSPEDLEKLNLADIHIFLESQEIKNEVGDKLDFIDHPYLWDMYTDLSPFQVVMKAAQIGFTTLAIIKSLWLAKSKRMEIIYTMPTATDSDTLVTSKVNRIIEQNPKFQQWVDGRDTVSSKRVGDSMIYYRGTFVEGQAISIASDLNIHDEVDRSNMPVIEVYESRLQHSKYAWQWLFSNPSVPGFGVDKHWQESDQKHYFYKCSSCGKQQYLTMKNILQGPDYSPTLNTGYYFACVDCKSVLSRRKGQWVAKYKGRSISGYWVSALMSPHLSADYIMRQKNKPADYFDNFVLGLPHSGSGNSITRDIIMQNLTSEINTQKGKVVIGVDPGIDIRIVIGNREGIFYHGECKDWTEVENLLARYPRSIMVIDQGGEISPSRKLREKYPNRVYLAFYNEPKKTGDLFEWQEDKGVIVIDRNNTITLLRDEFTEKRIPIFGTELDWEPYWEHWSHIYRAVEEDKYGRPKYKWLRSGRDDYVHGTVYFRAGIDKFLNGEGSIISNEDSFGEFGITSINGRMQLQARQKY